MTQRSNVFEFKVVILGDSGVGKSCVMNRFLYNRFDPNHAATIGLDFGTKNICYKNMVTKLRLFDTGGHERFESVNRVYYKHTDGVILMCDINDIMTQSNLGKWMDEVNKFIKYENKNVPVYIVYNKIDLVMNDSHIDDTVFNFATSNKLPYFVTSAVTNYNIDEMFVQLTNEMVSTYDHENEKKALSIFTVDKSNLVCC